MKFNRWANLWEFIAINGRLFVAMIAAVVALVALQMHTSSEKKECMGVVDLKETNIAFDTSVIVKNVFVLPGQKVKRGQALLEVKPIETTMKLLELKTQMDQLTSEKDIVDSLFASTRRRQRSEQLSPVELQIEGLRKQIVELEQSMKQAVRFAENDGIVGSVNFRVSEQVPPFQPVITLNSSQPNLVYGFIHEDRISEFKLGESIKVESLNRKSKFTTGNVVSLGSRITRFPERLTGNPQLQYWGREIVVSLPDNNLFMPGEKVRLLGQQTSQRPFLQILKAMAVDEDNEHPKVVAYNLPFEASGLVTNPLSKGDELILVSDDLNKENRSPFWKVRLNQKADANHSPLSASHKLSRKEDLESLAVDGGQMYALGSMSSINKGQNLVVFQLGDKNVHLKKVLPFRRNLIDGLKQLPVMKNISYVLEKKTEVEAFAVRGGEAFLVLKKSLFEDGSTVMIRISNFGEFVDADGKTNLEPEIVSPLNLRSELCPNSPRATDLAFFENDLLILTNCKDSPISQVWVFKVGKELTYPTLLKTMDLPRLEAIGVSRDKRFVYLADDNGNDGVSTVFKSPIEKSW